MRFLKHAAVIAVVMAASSLITATPAQAVSTCTQQIVYPTVEGNPPGALVPGLTQNPANVSCQLLRGHHNAAVGLLQFTLNLCYWFDLEEDNDFGPATEAALKQVQGWLKIKQDGIYGPITRDSMTHPTAWTCLHVNGPGGV